MLGENCVVEELDEEPNLPVRLGALPGLVVTQNEVELGAAMLLVQRESHEPQNVFVVDAQFPRVADDPIEQGLVFGLHPASPFQKSFIASIDSLLRPAHTDTPRSYLTVVV